MGKHFTRRNIEFMFVESSTALVIIGLLIGGIASRPKSAKICAKRSIASYWRLAQSV